MRDLLVIALVLLGAGAALRRPWVGVMLWTWLSIMNPHRFAWGWAYDAPLAAIAAGATFIGLVMTKDRESPFKGRPVTLLALFMVWMTLSWLFGLSIEGDYYQWNKDGNAISGANSQTYQATVAGSYTVTVRDSNGCENTSPPKLPLAISNVANGNSTFVLYPNPNTGTFVVEGTITSTDGKAAIEITDVTGKLVYREDVKTMSDKLNHTINISNVASGAYMIRIVSDNAREVVPFVKR